MNIDLDQQSPTNALIKIKLNEADYQPEVEKKIKAYSKQIQLKGFRPGKVPPAIVKRMYGKSILLEEINQILSKSLYEYLREKELKVVGEPLPVMDDLPQVDFGQEFEFSYRIGIVPEFNYDLEQLEVTNYQITQDESQVQEIIENIRRQYGDTSEVETSEAGDFVKGDLKKVEATSSETSATAEETPETEEPQEPSFHHNILLPLNQLNEEVVDQFIGFKAGDTIPIDNIQNLFKTGAKGISLATGISQEEAEALEGDFEFTIESISHTELAELNEEFFQKVFPDDEIATEEQFLEKVNNTIAENYKREAESYVYQQIQKQILEKTEITLPDEFLKDWLVQANEGKFEREEIEEEYDEFAKGLRWDLIKEKIVKEAEIKVEQAEVEQKARQMILSQFGGYLPQSPEMQQYMDTMVQNYLQSEDGKNAQQLINQVLQDKVMDHLRNQVDATEAEISREEFEKLFA